MCMVEAKLAMVVATAVRPTLSVIRFGGALSLVTLVALGADVVLARRAVVPVIAIVAAEISAVVPVIAIVAAEISAVIPVIAIVVAEIAAVIVATGVCVHDVAVVGCAGARRRSDVRAAVIERSELRAIVAGLVAMLDLIAGCVEVAIMIGHLVFTSWASVDSAVAAVVADARDVVHDDSE